MSLFEPDLKPSSTDLRWFAALWLPAFALMLGIMLSRKLHMLPLAVALWTLTAALALMGLLYPDAIRPVYVGLIRITFPIGWVMSHVILGVAYFGIMTIAGLLLRLFHDPMQRNFDRSANSYWVRWESPTRDRYFRQM